MLDSNLSESLVKVSIRLVSRGDMIARSQYVEESAAAEAAYPLTPLQAGLLAHHLWDPRSGVDIEQLVCTLPEAPDVPALRQAWADVVTHHEVLRTGFRWEGLPEPIQEIRSFTIIPFQELDWSSHSAEQVQVLLESFLADDRRIGFDLASPPLLRITLIRTGVAASTLIWTFHHILLDGRAGRQCFPTSRATTPAPRSPTSPGIMTAGWMSCGPPTRETDPPSETWAGTAWPGRWS